MIYRIFIADWLSFAQLHIYYGSSSGIDTSNENHIEWSLGYDDVNLLDGYDICCQGDDNNDDKDDIVLSDPGWDSASGTNEGQVYGIHGDDYIENMIIDWDDQGENDNDLYGFYRLFGGKALCGIPDVDSDGDDEIAIGIPNIDSSYGEVNIYPGS